MHSSVDIVSCADGCRVFGQVCVSVQQLLIWVLQLTVDEMPARVCACVCHSVSDGVSKALRTFHITLS